jgi:hypothetical protein
MYAEMFEHDGSYGGVDSVPRAFREGIRRDWRRWKVFRFERMRRRREMRAFEALLVLAMRKDEELYKAVRERLEVK